MCGCVCDLCVKISNGSELHFDCMRAMQCAHVVDARTSRNPKMHTKCDKDRERVLSLPSIAFGLHKMLRREWVCLGKPRRKETEIQNWSFANRKLLQKKSRKSCVCVISSRCTCFCFITKIICASFRFCDFETICCTFTFKCIFISLSSAGFICEAQTTNSLAAIILLCNDHNWQR